MKSRMDPVSEFRNDFKKFLKNFFKFNKCNHKWRKFGTRFVTEQISMSVKPEIKTIINKKEVKSGYIYCDKCDSLEYSDFYLLPNKNHTGVTQLGIFCEDVWVEPLIRF